MLYSEVNLGAVCTLYSDLVHREGQILSVVIAVHHHFGVRSNESRFLLELILQQMNGFVHRFVEEPADESQRKHITALEHGFVIHPG